jgi:transcriptional regulator of arginine metabolism
MSKFDRHQAIRDLVDAGGVESQAQLRKGLQSRRLDVDQSTLSRDLAELDIRKIGGEYQVNGHAQFPATDGMPIDYSRVVRRIVTCGPNMIVLHTDTGQAQPVAIAIDEAADPAIAGTIAGDDTIFVATRGARQQTVALRRLQTWFGDKE